MHLLTKALGIAWAVMVGLVFAASLGVAVAQAPAAALLNSGGVGGFASPALVLGILSFLWVLADWRLAHARHEREHKAILRDKPGLANDPKALARERRIREKERRLQQQEVRALRAEDRAERRIQKGGKKENTLERKREHIAVKKERLRQRQ